MKYIVLIPDGAADYPLEKLRGKTPLEYATLPGLAEMARKGRVGLVRTVPEGMPPGSDTANLSVMGYDPLLYYCGRSPFEAAGMGVELQTGDTSFRCNLVTLSGEEPYEEKTLLDYSAGEISTAEAGELIKAVAESLRVPGQSFYPGVSYRHLMICSSGSPEGRELTPPHDIIGRKIKDYLPVGPDSSFLRELMEKSVAVLTNHEVNRARQQKGLNPANSIWLWGEGSRPCLPLFRDKYGLKGSVITAVDLIKGLGLYAGLEVVEVEGATGNFHTNYQGKAQGALAELQRGQEFVYIHIEAPDECAHQGNLWDKVKSLEIIDRDVVQVLLKGLERLGEDYRLMVLPDHATPLALRTHTDDPVPFLIFCKDNGRKEINTAAAFTEKAAAASGLYFNEGHRLMDYFILNRFSDF